MITYLSQTHETCVHGHRMCVINLTPDFNESEKRTAKRTIEQQLYDIFRKYKQPNA